MLAWGDERLFMKRVIASLSEVELEVLRAILQEAGIPAEIRHVERSGLPGNTPFAAELWVDRDADYPRAHDLFEAWCEPLPESIETWTCASCGQRLAVQFDSCWKCGTHRAAADPDAGLPCSCAAAGQRARKISHLLDEILHHLDKAA